MKKLFGVAEFIKLTAQKGKKYGKKFEQGE